MSYDNNGPIYSILTGKSYASCQLACDANDPTGFDGGPEPPGGCTAGDFLIITLVDNVSTRCCCASF